MLGAHETLELLVTVKAYPQLTSRFGEAVCVAGVRLDTEEPEWARLFPVQYRDLPRRQRFRKYQIIKVRAKRGSDTRAESWTPDVNSIELGRIVPAGGSWTARRELVEPLVGPTMCELNAGRAGGAPGASLGLVRPAVVRSMRTEAQQEWSASKAMLQRQSNLFSTKAELVQPKLQFSYSYLCEAEGCNGHVQKVVDWELGEAYRSWPHRDEEDLTGKIRERWLDMMCAVDRDPYFFVGDVHNHPGSFMVLGTFYPEHAPNPRQAAFF